MLQRLAYKTTGYKSASLANAEAKEKRKSRKKMEEAVDRAQEKLDAINASIAADTVAARQAVRDGNQARALEHLQDKKRNETRRRRLKLQVVQLRDMLDDMDEADLNRDLIDATRAGNRVLGRTVQEISVSDAEQTRDDLDRNKDDMNDIADAITGRDVGGWDVVDDDVQAELDMLQEQHMLNMFAATAEAQAPQAPRAPTDASAIARAEAELAALEAEEEARASALVPRQRADA